MYSSRAFVRLTGITAKALRYYERLGLLAPKRTAAGYRRYSPGDLGRAYRVLALKSLDLSLQTIKRLLDGHRVDLSSHRERLVRERDRLTRALDVFGEIPAQPARSAAFSRFVAEFTWEKAEATRQRHATTAPRAPDRVCDSRLASFRELARAIELAPASERTRALANAFRSTGDSEMQAAVRNRAVWPSGMLRYVASLYDADVDTWERVLTFVEALPPSRPLASP